MNQAYNHPHEVAKPQVQPLAPLTLDQLHQVRLVVVHHMEKVMKNTTCKNNVGHRLQ